MRIVAVSDTHTQQDRLGRLPPGDLLIHAGDFFFNGMDGAGDASVRGVGRWLSQQCSTARIFIAGNHDMPLQDLGAARVRSIVPGYMEDERVVCEGLRIYGSPLSRPYKHGGETERGDRLGSNNCFQKDSFDRIAGIPDADIDILITHGAPWGMCDEIDGRHVGCPVLMRKVRALRPRLHIFGHVHRQGAQRMVIDRDTVFVNACNLHDFAPCDGGTLYPPIVMDIARKGVGQPREALPGVRTRQEETGPKLVGHGFGLGFDRGLREPRGVRRVWGSDCRGVRGGGRGARGSGVCPG